MVLYSWAQSLEELALIFNWLSCILASRPVLNTHEYREFLFCSQLCIVKLLLVDGLKGAVLQAFGNKNLNH